MRYEGSEAFGSISISGPVDPTPHQDSPIFIANRHLEDELGSLSEIVNVLAKRLGPVLRPSEARPESAEKLADASATSDHAASLRGHVEYTSAIRRRIGDLLDRLEV